LYDIHGNLPALEAVLEELRAEDIDRIVVGGDVFPGPMSREALARLRNLDIPVECIRGNCETAVLNERAGRDVALPEHVRETMRWYARQIDAEEERFLAGWPLVRTLAIDGVGPVLFCHATPRDDNEIFTSTTPAERLAPAFANVSAPLVVCGHTHMQFDRTIDAIRVVNAGSVGMPFGEPGAYWLRIGPGVELRRTPYDIAAAAERIRATTYPQADEFAARYVLNPPSASEMLALFASHELK
jgi:predicted phosphodiesterase